MRADLFKLIDEPSILHCFSKEEALTPDEKARFTSWLAAAMCQRQFEWVQYQNRVADRATWETYRRLIPEQLATERARRWWQASTHFFELGFVESVDELLASAAPVGFFEMVEELEL